MEMKDFDTKEIITWCPGCPDMIILNSVKKSLANLCNKKIIKKENIVVVTGIGCAAKIFDYVNTNAYYSIHGRTIPTALGMSVANPELTILAFGGDGDVYAEGIQHLVHGARKNINMTMIVHDNQIFALTTGQVTPTTEPGFPTKSTPFGAFDRPMNPILFALSCGATFVARVSAVNPDHMTEVLEQAITHKGFSFVEVLQPCITFHNHTKDLIGKTYKLENNNVSSLEDAIKNAMKWNYEKYQDAKISVGIFYKVTRPILADNLVTKNIWHKVERKVDYKKLLEEYE